MKTKTKTWTKTTTKTKTTERERGVDSRKYCAKVCTGTRRSRGTKIQLPHGSNIGPSMNKDSILFSTGAHLTLQGYRRCCQRRCCKKNTPLTAGPTEEHQLGVAARPCGRRQRHHRMAVASSGSPATDENSLPFQSSAVASVGFRVGGTIMSHCRHVRHVHYLLRMYDTQKTPPEQRKRASEVRKAPTKLETTSIGMTTVKFRHTLGPTHH